MAGKDVIVLAGVEGGDVVVVMLVSEVVLFRLVLSLLRRDLVNTALTVKAVLPHGNSAGNARKEE